MHWLLFEDNAKNSIEIQKILNPITNDVIKKEIIKWLDVRIIYSNSDTVWVSLIQCVPKKGGITVIENEKNELIPTRTVSGWRICIVYRKLNKATRKDDFLSHSLTKYWISWLVKKFIIFLMVIRVTIKLPYFLKIKIRQLLHVPMKPLPLEGFHLEHVMHQQPFNDAWWKYFQSLIEHPMEVFMDYFLVFGESFRKCLYNLDMVLTRCEE